MYISNKGNWEGNNRSTIVSEVCKYSKDNKQEDVFFSHLIRDNELFL